MKKYKALMLDLDGTTLPIDTAATPSKKVIEAIQKAKQYVSVCAVTGRPYYLALPVLTSLGLTSPCILSGGALIIDPVTGTELWSKFIPKKEAWAICTFLLNLRSDFLVLDTNNNEKVFTPSGPAQDLFVIGIPETTLSRALEIEQSLEQFKNIAVHKVVGERKGHVWLQITHIEATKQYGIFTVAKLLGIKPHEIIGVGDGYNDFPLLMACGLKIAMGNAVDELKAIADYIAPSIDQDGIVDVIDKFILGSV